MPPNNDHVRQLPADAKIEAQALKPLIGLVATPKQIMNAVHYVDHLGNTAKDEVRKEAFEAVMLGGSNSARAWEEMGFCRIMGEPAAHVIRIAPNAKNLFEELHIVAQHWVILTGNGALGELAQYEAVKAAKAASGTMAGLLREFLEAYRREKGFEKWTNEHMCNVQARVVRSITLIRNRRAISVQVSVPV